MRHLKLIAPLVLALLAWQGVASAQSMSPETTFQISGWLQTRYEYGVRGDAENLSSFYMRRVRIDLRGRVVRPELTYRLMPELARTANLRDAWLNYAFNPGLQFRIGQFSVPFQWHRYVGASRQQFAERGVPSETFGYPTGRDIGVMLHGQNPSVTLGYALGFFDGSGRNSQLSNSDGHMASARLTWAALGLLPREESDLDRRAQPGLSFGVGVQGANKSEIRAWDMGRSPVDNGRADWLTGTADASLRWMGFSLIADGYLRRVDPDAPSVDPYTGWGYMISSGLFVMPRLIEVAARFSQLRLDSDAADTREAELGIGLNIYHRGHDVKTRIQFLTHHDYDPPAFGRDGVLLVEFHVQL